MPAATWIDASCFSVSILISSSLFALRATAVIWLANSAAFLEISSSREPGRFSEAVTLGLGIGSHCSGHNHEVKVTYGVPPGFYVPG